MPTLRLKVPSASTAASLGDPGPADDRAGLGDGEGGLGGFIGADAFQHGVGAVAVGQVLKRLHRRLAAIGDEVGRTRLKGEGVRVLVSAAEYNDPPCAEK